MSVHGQHPGLRPDLLGGEDPVHRHEQGIPVQQLQVPSELINELHKLANLLYNGYSGFLDAYEQMQIDYYDYLNSQVP
jgi:nitrogenase molybdenum-iron protein alpha/beta subunit